MGDSLLPVQRLVATWAQGARDEEIEHVVQTLKDALWRRGHDIPCERKGGGSAGSPGSMLSGDFPFED